MESMSSYFSTGITGAISLSTIAFVTVFAVLTGLTFIIMGVRVLAAPFQGGSKPSPAKSKAPAASVAAPTRPASPQQTAGQVTQAGAAGTSDPRILAVITAAIAAAGSTGFRITSVSPVSSKAGAGYPASMWRQASRMEGFERLDRQVWKKR